MPYRVFDGLLTGGVVIVPSEMSSYFRLFGLSEERVVYYEAADVFNMRALVERSLALFGSAVIDDFALEQQIDSFHIGRFGRQVMERVLSMVLIDDL